jgi:hypothetical protein
VEAEDSASSSDDLRTDPSATVSTTDSAVRLLSSYNAFLDRATPTPCVAVKELRTEAGDVSGSFYLVHVKTRDDLAKELDVELNASVKAPTAGSVDASTKVVQTFKESTTTVSFLLRAVRSYSVTTTSPVELTEGAVDLLRRGNLSEFVHQCGGSFAQTVRYEAQVIAMVQFEAKTEESALSIEASFGGATPAAKTDIAPGGTADLKTKAQQTASANDASLSITVNASGFLANPQTSGDMGSDSFEKIDALTKEMNDSFDKDLAGDRASYETNQRNVRPTSIAQASYGSVGNRPAADYSKLSAMLSQAEEFVGGIAPLYLRFDRAYQDEVLRFLGDEKNQFRYNLEQAPKLTTQELVPIAKAWATKLATDGSQDGSLVKPLRSAIDHCTAAASNGDYSPCTSNAALDGAKSAASAALAEYARSGRILPLVVSMPQPGSNCSYYNAESQCDAVHMRLPKRSEMATIAPAVSALAPPAAQVWVAGDGTCPKPVFANADGQGTFGCMNSFMEPLPFIDDQPVICVGLSGPITARPAP